MERSVVATKVGGPSEFVTPEAGVLVDPEDQTALAAALERAAAMPSPNPRRIRRPPSTT
jgi:glycosyltransferase involved in cell wall biosynthesis